MEADENGVCFVPFELTEFVVARSLELAEAERSVAPSSQKQQTAASVEVIRNDSIRRLWPDPAPGAVRQSSRRTVGPERLAQLGNTPMPSKGSPAFTAREVTQKTTSPDSTAWSSRIWSPNRSRKSPTMSPF